MQPCCEPDGIGTARLVYSQSSAVDSPAFAEATAGRQAVSQKAAEQAAAVQAYGGSRYNPRDLLHQPLLVFPRDAMARIGCDGERELIR